MCGRYFIDPGALDALLGLSAGEPGGAVKTQGEVFPTDAAPVLARSRAGRVKPFAMRWGFSVADGRRLINARSETAAASAQPKIANKMRASASKSTLPFESMQSIPRPAR